MGTFLPLNLPNDFNVPVAFNLALEFFGLAEAAKGEADGSSQSTVGVFITAAARSPGCHRQDATDYVDMFNRSDEAFAAQRREAVDATNRTKGIATRRKCITTRSK